MRDSRRARQGKPRGDDVLVLSPREVAKAIQAAADTFVAAPGPRMVVQRAPVHACGERLCGREVTSLRLGDPIEVVVVDLVRQKKEIIPQTLDATDQSFGLATTKSLNYELVCSHTLLNSQPARADRRGPVGACDPPPSRASGCLCGHAPAPGFCIGVGAGGSGRVSPRGRADAGPSCAPCDVASTRTRCPC